MQTIRLIKTSLIREDLDCFFLGGQEVGQLSLSIFVPFSALNTIIQGVCKPKLLNTIQDFMSVDDFANRLRSRRGPKRLAP